MINPKTLFSIIDSQSGVVIAQSFDHQQILNIENMTDIDPGKSFRYNDKNYLIKSVVSPPDAPYSLSGIPYQFHTKIYAEVLQD